MELTKAMGTLKNGDSAQHEQQDKTE